MGEAVVSWNFHTGPHVDRADRDIILSGEILDNPPEGMTYEGGVFTITASNGVWRYKVDPTPDLLGNCHTATLIDRETQS